MCLPRNRTAGSFQELVGFQPLEHRSLKLRLINDGYHAIQFTVCAIIGALQWRGALAVRTM